MKKYIFTSKNEETQMTLLEIINLNQKVISNAAIAGLHKGNYEAEIKNALKIVPKKIHHSNFCWDNVTKEELIKAGFKKIHKDSKIFLCPINTMNLIPHGTFMYDIFGKLVKKSDKLDLSKNILGSAPYGLIPKK